jgi:hypothetical protein
MHELTLIVVALVVIGEFLYIAWALGRIYGQSEGALLAFQLERSENEPSEHGGMGILIQGTPDCRIEGNIFLPMEAKP